MRHVTVVIVTIGFLSVYSGCGSNQPKSNPDLSILPQKVEVPKLGKVNYIEYQALLDSIDSRADLQLIFMQDYEPPDPAHLITLPGMKTVMVGEVMNYVKKLDKSKPLYLVCIWGDDSKRMGGELAKAGWNSYYLDGGTYRLGQALKLGKVKLNTSRS